MKITSKRAIHFRSYQTTLHFAFYMYIMYVFLRALLCMLMLCPGQLLLSFGINMRPSPKGKKNTERDPSRSEAELADVCIFYLWECAPCSNILWNCSAECDLKKKNVVCQRKKAWTSLLVCLLLSSLEIYSWEIILFATVSLYLLQQTVVFAVINDPSVFTSCNLFWVVTYHCVFPLPLGS